MTKRVFSLIFAAALAAAGQQIFTPGLKPFIAVDNPVIALEHVRVIDGTGAAPVEDQTIIIDHGRIQSVGPSDRAQEVAEKVAHRSETRATWAPSHWSAVVGEVSDLPT
jgi:hypothetical protein